jgi:ribonuclease HI
LSQTIKQEAPKPVNPFIPLGYIPKVIQTQTQTPTTVTGGWQDVFHSPLYERGHNNLGEFLAIIDACQRLERGELKCATLWSDSKTALSWFRTGKIRTTIDVDGQCDSAFAAAVKDARKWLESANRTTWFAMMSRWDTSARGENPADFGRK